MSSSHGPGTSQQLPHDGNAAVLPRTEPVADWPAIGGHARGARRYRRHPRRICHGGWSDPVGPASWLIKVGMVASLKIGPGLSAWRARDEPLCRYAAISVLAVALWVVAAALGVAAGAAVVWVGCVVTIDSRIRDAVLVWTTLVPRLGAVGRGLRRCVAPHPAQDHRGRRT